MCCSTHTSLAFSNNAPVSASAADDSTFFIVTLIDRIGPFRGGTDSGGFVGSNKRALKKCTPPDMLRDFGSERYDISLCV